MTNLFDEIHSQSDILHESVDQDLLLDAKPDDISSWRLNGIEGLSFRLGLAPVELAQTLNERILHSETDFTSDTLLQFEHHGYTFPELLSATLTRFDTTKKEITLDGEVLEATLFDVPMVHKKSESDILLQPARDSLDEWIETYTEVELLSETLCNQINSKSEYKNFNKAEVEKTLAEELAKNSIQLPKVRHQKDQSYSNLFEHVNHISKAARYASIKQTNNSLSEVVAFNLLDEVTRSVEERLLAQPIQTFTPEVAIPVGDKFSRKVLSDDTLRYPHGASTIAPAITETIVPNKKTKLIDKHSFDELCDMHKPFIDKALEKVQQSQFIALFKDDEALQVAVTLTTEHAREAARHQLESMKTPVTASTNPKTQKNFTNRVASNLYRQSFENGLAINPLATWQQMLNSKNQNEVYKSYNSKLVNTLATYVKDELELPDDTSYKALGIKKNTNNARNGFVPANEIQKLVTLAENSKKPNSDKLDKDIGDYALELLSNQEKLEEMLKYEALCFAEKYTGKARKS